MIAHYGKNCMEQNNMRIGEQILTHHDKAPAHSAAAIVE
jgi:hypothetical protein